MKTLKTTIDLPDGYQIDDTTGFIQIVDFPKDPKPLELTDGLEREFGRVRQYLHSVAEHKACPYVGEIEKRQGYYFMPIFHKADYPQLEAAAHISAEAFLRLDESKEEDPESFRFLSTMTSFHHPENNTEDFCKMMDCCRDKMRLILLKKGLMISQMHPYHPRESARRQHSEDSPLYSSGIPLLMIRGMHKVDSIFMGTPKEMELYRRRFPVKSES